MPLLQQDPWRVEWSKGVLRGLDVGVGDGDVVVNCASSHLTLFTISDESETAKWWSRRCRRWRTVWWHKTTWTYGWPPRKTGEYKVVLRQWMGFGEGVKLAVLNVITTNSFVGLMFSWDHEAVVFGRPDMTLFGAVLMTVLSSFVLLHPTSFGAADDVWLALWNVFVLAVLKAGTGEDVSMQLKFFTCSVGGSYRSRR